MILESRRYEVLAGYHCRSSLLAPCDAYLIMLPLLFLLCVLQAVRSEAASHFRAVCRALVSESIELSTFLEKTRRAKEDREHNEELQELALQDWVSLEKMQADNAGHGRGVVALLVTNSEKS